MKSSVVIETIILVVGLLGGVATGLQEDSGCGYQACTKSDVDKLNIHLVPHSHDDVGWLKTVDQYFFGLNESIQRASVKEIIDSVLEALQENPNRKFIYVETAFLWKWWKQQNEYTRQTMRRLINEGRLEIIGGGWVMNDEATTHYQAIIDQFTWGFRRLNDTFGDCARPKIGWQIDPFGHSREQASIFANMGFDGQFFARIDYKDKRQRLKNKNMEFIWQASPSLGTSANLFSSVLFNHYSAPQGFCFDELCQYSPLDDDPLSSKYNIEQRVRLFLSFVNEQALSYRTNNIMITMGDDFHYRRAPTYFRNLDKLIEGVNKLNGTRYKVFYSTPSCYLKAVNERNLTWSTKKDDFFPYASGPHAFWVGYFTSRPTLKFFERTANNLLQIVKQLTVLSNTPDSSELQLFREAMAVMQHHDAVTGTEKQHVAEDYARILHRGMSDGVHLASQALGKWMSKDPSAESLQLNSCLLLNISSCEYSSEHTNFVVTVYNPSSQPLNTYVRLPVADWQYSVKDFSGKELASQLVPLPDRVIQIPGRVSDSATQELVFRAVDVAPLSYQSFYVERLSSKPSNNLTSDDQQQMMTWKLEVNEFGRLTAKKLNSTLKYEQRFEYYLSMFSSTSTSSGAYIFRPRGEAHDQSSPLTGKSRQFKGPLVQEIQQEVNSWLSQVVRVYSQEDYVEFNWLVGPIPLEYFEPGKEVIVKYTSTGIENGEEFYTDSNAREMIKRKHLYKSVGLSYSGRVLMDDSKAGNYYPVTAKISIEDSKTNRRMSVLTDRAQGGSSLNEGQIELMLHRRLHIDDGFGVAEPLNERAHGQALLARGRHVVLLHDRTDPTTSRDQMLLREKEQAGKLAMGPWLFFTPVDKTYELWSQQYNMKGEQMLSSLPRNVRVLTLEPWKDGIILLRLEHLFETNETIEYSLPARVTINDLFPKLNVLSVVEMTLGANQPLQDNQRLHWSSLDDQAKLSVKQLEHVNGKIIVELKPMQIRTFLVTLVPGNSN